MSRAGDGAVDAPPSDATARSAPTVDVPWRRLDPRMLVVGPLTNLAQLLPVVVIVLLTGRSGGLDGAMLLRSGCDRLGGGVRGEVDGERDQLAVGLRGVGRLQALVELLEVDAPLAGRLAQHLGDLVPVLVGDAHPARVRALEATPMTGSMTDSVTLVSSLSLHEGQRNQRDYPREAPLSARLEVASA